jgi:transposase-like protein
MKKRRKHHTPGEKIGILMRHLPDTEPISKLCDELGSQPTVFYRWQKELFEKGVSAFGGPKTALDLSSEDRVKNEDPRSRSQDENA